MSALSYEAVARFAQQGGAVYFVILFVIGAAYAFWPKNKEKFDRAARAPLNEEPRP
ncbi:MAG TPA: cbb3-type cytochrome c oxidase subunit 3 [Caulobacteraceae bacterium]|nr:cbb3-type cytochrome c oxidase subunit 3 [Caulobacteraceae bacterium]